MMAPMINPMPQPVAAPLQSVQMQPLAPLSAPLAPVQIARAPEIQPQQAVVENRVPAQAQIAAARPNKVEPTRRLYAALKPFWSMPSSVDLSQATTGSADQSSTATFSETLGIGGALGYRFTPMFRAEGEFSRQQYDLETVENLTENVSSDGSGHLTLYNLMVNGYLDFPNSTEFTPYLGTGVGATLLDGDNLAAGTGQSVSNVVDGTAWAPTGMVTAGTTYALNDAFDLDLAYKAFFSGDLSRTRDTSEYGSDVLVSHNAVFGMRYNFDSYVFPEY